MEKRVFQIPFGGEFTHNGVTYVRRGKWQSKSFVDCQRKDKVCGRNWYDVPFSSNTIVTVP